MENARRLYTSAARLIRILKLAVVVIFTGIVLMTYKAVFTSNNGLGAWFLPVALGLILLPNIFYFFKQSNSKQSV